MSFDLDLTMRLRQIVQLVTLEQLEIIHPKLRYYEYPLLLIQ